MRALPISAPVPRVARAAAALAVAAAIVLLGALAYSTAAAVTPSTGAGDSSRTVLAGSDSTAVAQDASAPVHDAARRPRGHNVLTWPVYVRWDSDEGSALRVYGPVTVSWRSPDTRSFYAVFPTTGVRFSSGRSEYRLAWPLASVERDPAHGYSAAYIATRLVGYERRSSPQLNSLRVSPLYSNVRAASGLRRSELAPLWFRREAPSGQRETEFGYVPTLGGHGLALYRSWSTPSAHGWNAGYLLFGGSKTARSHWLSLPPYVSYDLDSGPGAPVHFRTIVPLYASWHSPGGHWWSAAIVYGGGRIADRTWLSAPPYFSSARTDASGEVSRFRTLVPLFGQWRTARREIAVALPSLWRYRSERMSASGAWPLYAWFRRTRGDSLGRSGGSVAWPLVTWGRGEGYSSLGILPLYYRVSEGETSITLVPPLFGSVSRPGLEARIVVPFYVRWWRGADSLEAITAYYRRRQPGRRIVGVFPFYQRLRSAEAQSDYVLPFYFHRRDAASEETVYPGWAEWRSIEHDRVTRLIGPLVFTHGRDTRGFGVVPIYYSGSGPAGTATLAGPVYWSRASDGGRRVVVAPLAWYSRSRGTTDLHLLPLSGYRSHADGRRLLYVLWPLYTLRTEADGGTRASLLYWLGRDETRGARRRAWLQPFVYYDRTSSEKSYLALVGGLLSSYERTGATRTLKVLMIPVRTWGG